MKKAFLLLYILLFAASAIAQSDFVSPETYAVNEADFTDYRYIAPRFDVDNLVDKPQKVQKEESPSAKSAKIRKEKTKKPLEKRLSYKVAKWWVDQRYKREEAHHGNKHEIKVKARENYEKQLLEKDKPENI